MRIGVVACECLKKEMEMLTEEDADITYKEYLEFGLHSYPQDLKREIVRKVNSLKGQVDAVFLGYGVCNSLQGIVRELEVPTATIAADDCIGALITPEEYSRERKVCAGTMYHIPFVSEMGLDYFEKELTSKMPDYKERGVDLEWFLDIMFDGYSRCLFIDTGIGERERYEGLSREFARKRNLRHESREGTLEMLKAGLTEAKALASRAA
ncbi:MAG: DUF1638 domain-containing protein [Methanomassiliicoccales archaeon]|nr:DUF1638 domain-containing protein [Methanomassiliicoccales archaeon]